MASPSTTSGTERLGWPLLPNRRAQSKFPIPLAHQMGLHAQVLSSFSALGGDGLLPQETIGPGKPSCV